MKHDEYSPSFVQKLNRKPILMR